MFCLVLQTSDGLDKLEANKLAEDILNELDGDKDGCITCEEYQVWTVNHPLPGVFLDLLFQVRVGSHQPLVFALSYV